jgi:hypothetical protein
MSINLFFLSSRVSILDLKVKFFIFFNAGEEILDKFITSNKVSILNPLLQLGMLIPDNKVKDLMLYIVVGLQLLSLKSTILFGRACSMAVDGFDMSADKNYKSAIKSAFKCDNVKSAYQINHNHL